MALGEHFLQCSEQTAESQTSIRVNLGSLYRETAVNLVFQFLLVSIHSSVVLRQWLGRICDRERSVSGILLFTYMYLLHSIDVN